MRTTPIMAIPYPEPSDNTQTWLYWQGMAERLDQIVPKYAAGLVTIPFANVASASASVTFPAGLFTANPSAMAIMLNGSTFFASVASITVNGMSVTLRHFQGTLNTHVGYPTPWIAMQARPGAATMRADDPPPASYVDFDGNTWVLRVVTCHTADCPNSDIPIETYVLDVSEPAVSCGVCGQPITDIT